jgi:hypothetical protein
MSTPLKNDSDSGRYERRLLFDNVVAAQREDARDRFEVG